MVEITTTTLIDKAKSFMGLRGKAIVSSRNSLYPVVIVNADEQSIPVRPATPPVGALYTRIAAAGNLAGAAIQTLYQAPVGKVGFITYVYVSNTGATNAGISLATSADVKIIYLAKLEVAGQLHRDLTCAIRVEAGEKIIADGGAAATGNIGCYGWEQQI